MIRLLGLLIMAGMLAFAARPAQAQSLRVRTGVPQKYFVAPDPWSGYFRYNIATDYAEQEQPRAYTHVLGGGAKYSINDNWSVTADLTMKTESINGQIEKGPEQSKTEVLNPSVAMEVDYERRFYETHGYTLFMHGEPLMDEPSRLEGYRGIVGVGAAVTFGFFNRRYQFSNTVDASNLINTYDYSLAGASNPDMFYTYKMGHSLRIWRTVKLGYAFGLKLTRRLDASTKHAYNNTVSISNTWRSISMALAYDNGGYTDDGSVSMWYIDQYRRVFQFKVNYSF